MSLTAAADEEIIRKRLVANAITTRTDFPYPFRSLAKLCAPRISSKP